jgi:uncharacterized protein (TIGR03437 family)
MKNLITSAICLMTLSTAARAQTQANVFLDDSVVQVINLAMNPNDWATLQQNYLLDTYYHATFTWNGISEDIGIRSHGGGSRSPIKPNLDLNFAHYEKNQTFLGLPFILIKANNEDPSNLHEWISMKLFRKMGMPAPREAPAQVFINGQLLGFYYIVEHEDETFLNRNFGESGGYLYEWEYADNYEFQDLGTDPSAYAPFLDLKTDQASPDLQTFAKFVQVINQPSSASFTDADFISALSQYLNPSLFLTHAATENVLAEQDGLLDGMVGLNNFYLYQFQNTTLYQMIAWDKDLTFGSPQLDVMDGIWNGTLINLLAQRLVDIPQYQQVYLNALVKAATLLGGTGGWADSEITREYGVIYDAAMNDPNKQWGGNPATSQDFENGVAYIHSFLSQRSNFVLTETGSFGYQPLLTNPLIASGVVSTINGEQQFSPGVLASVATNLALTVPATAPTLPRIMQNTFVAVEGVRAPLVAASSGEIEFQLPLDIPGGTASIVVSNNGSTSNTADVPVVASTPFILSVVHADGSEVSGSSPPVPGEVVSASVMGLGTVGENLPIGAAAPADPPATTVATPQMFIGKLPMTVTFSGLAPGSVGLYQVNATVPANLPQLSIWTSGCGITLIMNGQSETWASVPMRVGQSSPYIGSGAQVRCIQ